MILRGEQSEVLTGYNLVSTMYGNVMYVPRSKCANRKEILRTRVVLVAGEDGSVLWAKDHDLITYFFCRYDSVTIHADLEWQDHLNENNKTFL